MGVGGVSPHDFFPEFCSHLRMEKRKEKIPVARNVVTHLKVVSLLDVILRFLHIHVCRRTESFLFRKIKQKI